jgi:cytochrome c55X
MLGKGLTGSRAATAPTGLLFFLLGLTALNAEAQPPTVERARELVHLVRQDCGSCHGLTLKGGLGPALTAEALRDKAPASLAATIIHGRPGTPMPPFRGIVAEAEAEWIVQQLLAGFPSPPAP